MMSTDADSPATRLERAKLSLDGLSLGDAFGECFFELNAEVHIRERRLPEPWWFYTDDTIMARSIVEVLERHGAIDQDDLAARFAKRFIEQPNRGYGGAAIGLLQRIAAGADWRHGSRALFNGEGSMGNGGAMRVGPVGAYFADDLDAVVSQARLSAEVTHAHPEGQAGAIAIAAAAALAWRCRDALPESPQAFMEAVLEHVPSGHTHDGIRRAIELPADATIRTAAATLGSGQMVISSDTVPFSLWCAARRLDAFEEAMWDTVAGYGDRDTTCAISGSIVAMAVEQAGLPEEWLRRREPLED